MKAGPRRVDTDGLLHHREPADAAPGDLTALLLIRSPTDVDEALVSVGALLAARRAAGVVDVVVGALIGSADAGGGLEP